MSDSYESTRLAMVEQQIRERGVHDERVLEVMRRLPRHEFIPEAQREQAYADCPLPIGEDQTISQPYIVAVMTAALHLTGKERVLKDVSFELMPGKVLGLLGRTGSGKTTLTRLLFRLYDPDEGTICLYGPHAPTPVDLRDLPLAALRRRIGLVTQEVQFFRASLRDNLTFFKADVPDAQITQVIEDLGLGEWLQSLPAGLDTVLEGGAGLSAGQAQLLACSRIFLYHPDVFILDEAASRLDPLTEGLLNRAVERLVGTCTMIIIAHRLETVERADEILILENGRVLEKGPRAALASNPASYYRGLLHQGLADLLA